MDPQKFLGSLAFGLFLDFWNAVTLIGHESHCDSNAGLASDAFEKRGDQVIHVIVQDVGLVRFKWLQRRSMSLGLDYWAAARKP